MTKVYYRQGSGLYFLATCFLKNFVILIFRRNFIKKHILKKWFLRIVERTVCVSINPDRFHVQTVIGLEFTAKYLLHTGPDLSRQLLQEQILYLWFSGI